MPPAAVDQLAHTGFDTAATGDPQFQAPVGFARCQLDVSTGGKVKLLLNSPIVPKMWLDSAGVEPEEQMVLDLAPGLHTLTLAIRIDQRQEGLRCELDDVPGSPARVQIVTGN